MQWWTWAAVGAILLGAELTFVNAEFFLVFIGASALIVGVLALLGVLPSSWLQWLVFTALALSSMLTFRRQVYERMRGRLPEVRGGLVGETIRLPNELEAGQTCRVEFRGSSWDAVNAGSRAIASGEHALIDRVDGLTLVLRSKE